MTEKKKSSRTLDVLASDITAEATGEAKSKEKPQKNPAAQELGRLGGMKGGKARAEKLTAKQRKEIAKKAAKVRWGRD